MARWIKRVGIAMAGLLLVVGLGLVVFRTPDTDPVAMRAKYGAPPSQFVDLGNGLTVHLRDEGPRDAPTIILLHGANDDLHAWDAWVARLSATYRLIRYDTIGHGLTGGTVDKDYSARAMADVVERVADTLNIETFVIAGSSMGGGVAVEYALHHQDRLDGLVLVDAGGAPTPGALTRNLGMLVATTPGLNRIMDWTTPRWIVAQNMRQSVATPEDIDSAKVDRIWELLRHPGNREATRIRSSTPVAVFEPATLATIAVPTLILWGERDSILPVTAGHWFHAAIPGSRLIVYPGIGHLPVEEAAAQSSDDFRKWIVEIGPRSRP